MKRFALFFFLLAASITCPAQLQFGPGIQVGAGMGFGALSAVVLGSTGVSSTYSPGFQAAAILPILMPGSAAGYTLNNFTVNVNAAQQVNLGIYSSGTTNCPSGVSFCANALLCSDNSVTPSVGLNTYPASAFGSCGTFSANTYYYLVVHSTGSGVTLNSTAGSFCPGTGYYGLHYPVGAGSLPTPMGVQDEPSAQQCPAISALFNCAGPCGAAPVPWVITSFAGNSNGAAVTTGNLVTGACGLNGGFVGTLTASTTYSNAQTQALPTAALCNATSYSGGTLSVQRTVSSTDYFQYAYNFGVSGSNTTVLGFWIYNSGNTQGSATQFDLGEIDAGNTLTFGSYGGTGAGFCASSGAPPCFKVERSGGTTNFWGDIPFSQNTWYFLAIFYTGGGSSVGCGGATAPCFQAGVFNTSGVELTNAEAASLCSDGKSICITESQAGAATGWKMLDAGSGVGVSAGTWYYGPVLLDPLGISWPTIGATYGEIFFPDSPSVIGRELAAKVGAGLIPHAVLRGGRWFSYALQRDL